MAFSVVTVRDALINVLSDSNTTTSTYYLSNGLEQKIQHVGAGSEQTPITTVPYIVVRPESKTFEEVLIGDSGRRDIESEFRIFCAVDVTEQAEDEIYRLTDNIEFLLANRVDLSATVSYSEVVSTSWSVGDDGSTFSHSGEVIFRTQNNSAV